MRICHVIETLDPETGGPPIVVSRLAAAQSQMGHEITIVSSCRPDRREANLALMRDTPGYEGVRVLLGDAATSVLARLRATVFLDALEKAGPFDALHLHGVWNPCLPKVGAWARKQKTPYVVMPHGMLDTWSLEQRALKKKLAMALVYRSFLNGASSIHALNRHEAETIGAQRFTAPRDVIPNGIFLDEVLLKTGEDAFRRSLPELGEHPYFLFLSRLHFKKGLDILAEAWERLSPTHPTLRLVVAGPSEDNSREDFERRLGASGLTGTVFLTGPIYGTRKTAAFRESLAFVLPSRQEGFSIAITESLGLGTPVVITHSCNFPEVAAAGAGLVTDLDAGRFAEAMARVADDGAGRSRMAENAAALVRDNYTWPRIAEQTFDLYRRITRRGD